MRQSNVMAPFNSVELSVSSCLNGEAVTQKALLETLLGAGGGAIRLWQGHDAVRVLQMRLQGLLVGRLQGVVQMLCLSAEVTVETPVAPGNKAQHCEHALVMF